MAQGFTFSSFLQTRRNLVYVYLKYFEFMSLQNKGCFGTQVRYIVTHMCSVHFVVWIKQKRFIWIAKIAQFEVPIWNELFLSFYNELNSSPIILDSSVS